MLENIWPACARQSGAKATAVQTLRAVGRRLDFREAFGLRPVHRRFFTGREESPAPKFSIVSWRFSGSLCVLCRREFSEGQGETAFNLPSCESKRP